MIDFKGDAGKVWLVVEGKRLSYGHLFNPTFGTEVSRIDPLPHQRLAVYEHMLPTARLRFLLADDAGAGKTIMTGLYIREMLSRHLVARVLIVPPAGLVGNWKQELHRLFDLDFTIISGSDARRINPFTAPDSDLAMVSVSTLSGERVFNYLRDGEVKPYDLVVFDEAHKLSAYRDQDLRVHKTARFKLAEALAGVYSDETKWQLSWSLQHLLLLTATPHMGKDIPYYYLWSLLEPEVFTSYEAFRNYPAQAKHRYFLRRTKEEMIDFTGKPIYPERKSRTLCYDLTQGAISEQALYDETTHYIQNYYNAAAQLNRSAARLVMSVFQRRLASSTWALLQSLLRRKANLQAFVEALESGKMPFKQFYETQKRLEGIEDPFETKTADEEESPQAGREENENSEKEVLQSTIAITLEELREELWLVQNLCDLAQQVFATVEDSKFEKLRSLMRDERYVNEKILIFTEHRDTLTFLVERLESMGYANRVASIHGGMDSQQREEEVLFFRRPIEQGGARFMVATDAAGEGINLQVCWIMLNYDLPWNPARLEQRMGRIHRYGQKHDPVYIFNLVAGKTREGRVMRILLDKLGRIKAELGNEKVFDVLGKMMEGISLQTLFSQLHESAQDIEHTIDAAISKERVLQLQQRDLAALGKEDTVRDQLPRLQQNVAHEELQWLLPGYMRQFIAHAAPHLGLEIEGSLDSTFHFRPSIGSGVQWLYEKIEQYPPEKQRALTIYSSTEKDRSIFLHPGEPVFDRLRDKVHLACAKDAQRGAVFVDPGARQPYLYTLAEVTILRKGDPDLPTLKQSEILEKRLVAFKQNSGGQIELCPIESILLLHPLATLSGTFRHFAQQSAVLREQVLAFAQNYAQTDIVEKHRYDLYNERVRREEAVQLGFEYLEIDLLNRRARLQAKRDDGNVTYIKGELTKIEKQYTNLNQRKAQTLRVLQREPELIEVGEIALLAHALVVPASDKEDRLRYDADVEQQAMRIAMDYERARGAEVFDVSKPTKASAAGLSDWPGFDLLARYHDGTQRAIEVKGRVGTGTIELSENEYGKACTLRDRYWLYVVFDCEKHYPRLVRVQDPFGKLVVRAKGSVLIDSRPIIEAEAKDEMA